MLNILTSGLDSRYINLQGSSPQKFGFGRTQKVNIAYPDAACNLK